MGSAELRVIGIEGIPEIKEGDDLASLIAQALGNTDVAVQSQDLFVVAQKVVSKAEGRVVRLDSVTPSPLAREWAAAYDKDARVVEVVLGESKRIVRMDRGVLISETRHGFVCANAGVDTSNVAGGFVTLLPVDPDESARLILNGLEKEFKANLGVIVSDTFGRPWREGLVNVAIGVAGFKPIADLRGAADMYGQPLRVTTIAIADEVASAAELVMAKEQGLPVALVRGLRFEVVESSSRDLIRSPDMDLFR